MFESIILLSGAVGLGVLVYTHRSVQKDTIAVRAARRERHRRYMGNQVPDDGGIPTPVNSRR